MPPSNQQLNWNEIREFGGLWTRSDSILGPANSATIMSGCHPQPGGGLRPFFKVSDTRPATGLGSTHIPRGFTPAYGIGDADHEFALVVAKTNGVDWDAFGWYAPDDIWEECGESGGGASEFSNDDSSALALARQPFFSTYQSGLDYSAVARHLYLVLPAASPGDSVYEFTTIAGGPEAGHPAFDLHPDWSAPEIGLGPICVHQSRLVICQDGVIVFSDPGMVNAVDAGQELRFIIPDATGKGDARIAWMAPIPPSDLLVCTVSGNLYNIQGDLADPGVRDLGRWGPSVYQQATLTPQGVVCIYPNDGVYLVSPDGGRQFISQALAPSIFTAAALANETGDVMGFGSIAYSNGYAFLPNANTGDNANGALVYDTATQAWFTSTHADDFAYPNPKHFAADFNGPNPGVWGVRKTLPSTLADPLLFRIVAGDVDAEAREQRNQTWEWQSQPLRNSDGRQIECREVQLTMFAGPDASVTVTVTSDLGSQVQTFAPAAGRSVKRLQFRVAGSFVQVKVKASDATADEEAPTLESLRWGTRPGHLL
jgi:hypothetical protein